MYGVRLSGRVEGIFARETRRGKHEAVEIRGWVNAKIAEL